MQKPTPWDRTIEQSRKKKKQQVASSKQEVVRSFLVPSILYPLTFCTLPPTLATYLLHSTHYPLPLYREQPRTQMPNQEGLSEKDTDASAGGPWTFLVPSTLYPLLFALVLNTAIRTYMCMHISIPNLMTPTP